MRRARLAVTTFVAPSDSARPETLTARRRKEAARPRPPAEGDRDEDDLRPARGVLASAIAGLGLWLLVGAIIWLTAR